MSTTQCSLGYLHPRYRERRALSSGLRQRRPGRYSRYSCGGPVRAVTGSGHVSGWSRVCTVSRAAGGTTARRQLGKAGRPFPRTPPAGGTSTCLKSYPRGFWLEIYRSVLQTRPEVFTGRGPANEPEPLGNAGGLRRLAPCLWWRGAIWWASAPGRGSLGPARRRRSDGSGPVPAVRVTTAFESVSVLSACLRGQPGVRVQQDRPQASLGGTGAEVSTDNRGADVVTFGFFIRKRCYLC